ncbi:MAG: DUF58 domain-containing protein [Myxococcales bacterium]|nr:DUF58 domain-containing protein [Myxococcales bacterium]
MTDSAREDPAPNAGAGFGERVRSWGNQYNRVRPTAAGAWYLVVMLGVAVGAMNTGNNLVYAVLSVTMGILVANNVLAEWNLRGLSARRSLPPELFAGQPARGSLMVDNPRRIGPALAIHVRELDGGLASAEVSRVEPGTGAGAPADWTFPTRGEHHYSRIRVGSSYPFGLLLRYRDLEVPGTVLVYPAPERQPAALGGPGDGVEGERPRGGVEQTGDFYGLREYHPGDPVRRIHARSSARIGTPMVMLRTGEAGSRVWVKVDGAGDLREQQIRRATAQVVQHTGRGDAVGLEADGVRVEPATGTHHRRALLTTLALL